MRTDTDLMCLSCFCVNLGIHIVHHNFLKYLGKEVDIGNWPVLFHVSIFEIGFLQ